MILFNWQKVFTEAEGNPYNCYQIIKMLTYKEVPKNRYDPIFKYSNINFTGESFLLNPDVLLYYAFRYSMKEVATYISIASIRSIADYISTNKVSLDRIKVPSDTVIQNILTENRLLTLDEDNIYFRYEEVPKEKH